MALLEIDLFATDLPADEVMEAGGGEDEVLEEGGQEGGDAPHNAAEDAKSPPPPVPVKLPAESAKDGSGPSGERRGSTDRQNSDGLPAAARSKPTLLPANLLVDGRDVGFLHLEAVPGALSPGFKLPPKLSAQQQSSAPGPGSRAKFPPLLILHVATEGRIAYLGHLDLPPDHAGRGRLAPAAIARRVVLERQFPV